jgi:hypothetical protein
LSRIIDASTVARLRAEYFAQESDADVRAEWQRAERGLVS